MRPEREILAREWAEECTEPCEGIGSEVADARRSFMTWLLDHRIKHTTDQRDDGKRWLKAQGWRTRRVDGVTYWAGLAVRYPENAPERPRTPEDGQGEPTLEAQPQQAVLGRPGAPGGPLTVASALRSLVNNGLVSREAARRAWEDLGGDQA